MILLFDFEYFLVLIIHFSLDYNFIKETHVQVTLLTSQS